MTRGDNRPSQGSRGRAKQATRGNRMNNQTHLTEQEDSAVRLPQADVEVDFGSPASGFSEPMPEERRAEYESRIRNSLDAQAAGAEKASKLFIR